MTSSIPHKLSDGSMCQSVWPSRRGLVVRVTTLNIRRQAPAGEGRGALTAVGVDELGVDEAHFKVVQHRRLVQVAESCEVILSHQDVRVSQVWKILGLGVQLVFNFLWSSKHNTNGSFHSRPCCFSPLGVPFLQVIRNNSGLGTQTLLLPPYVSTFTSLHSITSISIRRCQESQSTPAMAIGPVRIV